MLISSSSSNRSLLAAVIEQFNQIEVLNHREPSWILYLQDHRDLLRANSQRVLVDGEVMHKYRYRPRKFLSNHRSIDALELAFMITNRFRSNLDFDLNVTEVYIPDRRYVEELRKMWGTLEQQINKL